MAAPEKVDLPEKPVLHIRFPAASNLAVKR
jgi:hypothetical protein